MLFVNILTSISQDCDCNGGNDAPVVPDLGFMASTDPVAIDQASLDWVTQRNGTDPFRAYYPQLDTEIQIKHAEEIGLGSRKYELIEI